MGDRAGKAVVQGFFNEVFNGHDPGALTRYVAADVVDHDPLVFAQPEGPEGVEAGLRMLFVAFPDLHADVAELIAEGGTVVARLRCSGTNTGEYRGLPEPTMKRAEWRAIMVFRVADGKIAEIRGVADRMEMLTQLGILPDIG
jgi:steroid delta-isomerase-like uncharacterized protein